MCSKVAAVTVTILTWSLFAVATPSCGGDPTQDEALSGSDEALTSAAGAITSGPLASSSVAAARPVVTTDEQRHLVYELVIQNVGTTSVSITGIDVTDPGRRDGHEAIASYRDAALNAVLPAGGALPPGGITFAFIDLAFPLAGAHDPPARPLPRVLAHTITVGAGASQARLRGAQVPVRDDGALPPLSPPLRAENLLDLNGCCAGGHTRAVFPGVNGGFLVAQRYAIDFLRLTDEGSFSGDPTLNQSYFLYGADVMAAAPGRIVEVVDGLPENTPTQPLPPFSIDTAAGNHVVEALDDGRFALYAHMQPGSLRVAVGARVRRGQVLGLVGNTGNSTEPHLHFHVTDGPSPLFSNGLPYVFDRFDLVATIDFAAPDVPITLIPPPQGRRNRLPMNGDVVTFR